MSATDVATRHYRDRQRLAKAVEAEGRRLWRNVTPADLDASWLAVVARLLLVLVGAQRAAAGQADWYVGAVLAEQGVEVLPEGSVAADALSGVASDGRPLDGLLWSPVTTVKTAIAEGATMPRALAGGQATLDMVLRTQVADAGRVADGVAIASRPSIGYVRMLVGKSCPRCVILAGRFYRYNAGFRRHPACNCIHVPAKGEEAIRSEGLISDPQEYFDSLSEAEQNRAFTKAGAQAIRDGADMNQVVNARRGAAGLSKAGGRLTRDEQRMLRGGRDRGRLQRTDVFGQGVFATTEGTTRRGLAGQRLIDEGARLQGEAAETVTRMTRTGQVQRRVQRQRVQVPRLMPESIYELATSREDAIRLLKRFGYIL